jgi:hypothetical protein
LNVAKASIKRDENAVASIVYTYLSRWTDEPLNLFLKGESSIGKSYVTKNTIKILGEDRNVWFLGGLSPMALVHDYGTLKDEGGNEINVLDAPSRKKVKFENPDANKQQLEQIYRSEYESWINKLRNSYYEIDLTGKLLVFLEPPNLETFQKLRPILSHDSERISFRFTDKTKSGGLRTSNVVLKGFPATIFCTSEEEYLKDLSTRSLTLTPELSIEKIKEAVNLISKFSAYSEELLTADASEIKSYMEKVKVKAPKDVLTPFSEQIEKKIEYWGKRVMRDWKHLLTMVKMNAILNFENRPKVYIGDKAYLLTTATDFLTVLSFWSGIEETTITGISGSALEIFEKLIKPTAEVTGYTNYELLTQKSKEVMSEPLTSGSLRKYIQVLRETGFVETLPDPQYPKRKLIKMISEGRQMFQTNMLKNVYEQFKQVFSFENLKAWWETLNTICLQKRVPIQLNSSLENLLDLERDFDIFFEFEENA